MIYRKSFVSNLLHGAMMRIRHLFHPAADFHISKVYEIYLKHLPANKVHSTTLFKRELLFRGGPDYLMGLREIFVTGVYKQQLRNDAFIIDCGSHIGMSIIYLKRLCPSAEILGFEPDKQNFRLLTQNIESFQFDKVTLLNKAVWHENTVLNFLSEGDMTSRIGDAEQSNDTTEACRLYDYLDRKVDFLKMDIEGAEFDVLRDVEPRLVNVERLFVEYHGLFSQNDELLEMLKILRRANFSLYIKEAGPIYPNPFIAVRTDNIYDIQLNIFCFKTVS